MEPAQRLPPGLQRTSASLPLSRCISYPADDGSLTRRRLSEQLTRCVVWCDAAALGCVVYEDDGDQTLTKPTRKPVARQREGRLTHTATKGTTGGGQFRLLTPPVEAFLRGLAYSPLHA